MRALGIAVGVAMGCLALSGLAFALCVIATGQAPARLTMAARRERERERQMAALDRMARDALRWGLYQ